MLHRELLKKYKVLKVLHHGLGGDVCLAEHMGLSGRRVIKTIDCTHPWHDILVKEARMLQQCRHPSIPIIYDILEFDTHTYLIEEYIEGETLTQYIQRRRSLSDSLLLTYSTQLCDILQYLHHPARNILHLDLKPDNILISDHRVKLVDFGSAICRKEQKTQYVFGTPGFCAPEQETAGEMSAETDLYGLGRCMEYLLYHAKKVPKGYRKIVDNCLRRGQKQYQNAEQVRCDLEKLRVCRRTERPKEHWIYVSAALSEADSSLFSGMLACYLRKRYRKNVICLDCSCGQAMEGLRKKEDGFVTEQEGVAFAAGVAPEEIRGFRGRGYDYIVCDFGNRVPVGTEPHAYRRFLTGPMVPWMKKQWEHRMRETAGEKITAVITAGDLRLAKKELGMQCPVYGLSLVFAGAGLPIRLRRQMKHLLGKKIW